MAADSRPRFVCTECHRRDDLLRTAEDAARTAGWRFGTNGRDEPVAYCPECTSIDEDYWDRRTLAVAYMAGIDAGNTAWGQS
jgi:hypothetical protein